MTPHTLDSLSPILSTLDAESVRSIVASGLIALTVCVLVLARTQWGHSNPLRKCIVLSLLAHLLIGIYLTTVHIVSGGPPGGDAISIVLVDGSADMPGESTAPGGSSLAAEPGAGDAGEPGPADPAIDSAAGRPAPEPPPSPAPSTAPATAEPPSKRTDASDVASTPASPPPAASEPEKAADTATSAADPASAAAASAVAASNDVPPPDPAERRPETSPDSSLAALDASAPSAARPLPPAAPFGAAAGRDPLASPAPAAKPTPAIYSLRTAHDHVRVAEQHGGNEQTEAAVGAALQYLVANQSIDGRWNPRALEAGRHLRSDGPDRQGVGMQADSGLTGLCLLSLLAAGHTHLEGEYSSTVKQGLEYLLGVQAADGSLSGQATLYERMYCHGMAAFALSEALAMTGDERLQPAVRAAIAYTLRSQRGGAGGWRYQPGESGDMSQFGWQAMALKSAALGGVAIPEESRLAMQQFLQSVSSGAHGGLAAYRPGHPPSRAMTAEALVCRQFAGLKPDDPQSREAAEFVMRELPGEGPANVYYWYYGSLGMYQMQGVYWQRWNTALQKQLLASQRRDGKLAGSWNPDPVWGGYGGRAFSTALSTLCLEVYYRFLPLYAAHADAGRSAR